MFSGFPHAMEFAISERVHEAMGKDVLLVFFDLQGQESVQDITNKEGFQNIPRPIPLYVAVIEVRVHSGKVKRDVVNRT